MRRPARKYPEKSEVINFRIQPSTKAALKKAAAASGRTVSAEAEFQLQRALSDLGAGKTFAIMEMIAKTIDGLAATRKTKWWLDPTAYAAAVAVVTAAFELLRPPGQPQGDPLSEHSPRFAVETTLREIQTADLRVPFGEQRPYGRWLARLKQGLGDLADRPALWGQTADQARASGEAAAPILAELIHLSKKRDKTPAEMERVAKLERALIKSQQPIGRKKRK